MDYQTTIHYVEGLDLGKERIIWNDKMMFMDAGTKNGNIAQVNTLIKHPMRKMGYDVWDFIEKSGQDTFEAYQILNIFLACYKLSHDKIFYPSIIPTRSYKYPIKNVEDFKTYNPTHTPLFTTRFPREPVEDNVQALKKTIPLFEKVLKNIQFNKKRKNNPLLLALPIYQSIYVDEESIIDYTTILESLVCENEGELKFKFALRTSLLVGKNKKTRKSLFEFLKKVYNIRSGLVHGSGISIPVYSKEYSNIRQKLENLVKIALLNYIEFINSGLNKKEIIEKLDDRALGLSDDQ